MSHQLNPLSYPYDALEPYIDEQTMRIHHTKHHQTYIDKLNTALEGHDDLIAMPPEDLLKKLSAVPEGIRTAVRNHGGGHANHTFFWSLLKKNVKFGGPVENAINTKFGNYDAFVKSFSTTATLLFGSGWAWLVMDKGELEIVTTPNQGSPITGGKKPILGIDVWEHAYYLKYQNRRPEYVEAFFNVVNWEKVNEYFQAAS